MRLEDGILAESMPIGHVRHSERCVNPMKTVCRATCLTSGSCAWCPVDSRPQISCWGSVRLLVVRSATAERGKIHRLKLRKVSIMISALLITPMMLAVSQPAIQIPSTLIYDHQSQTSIGSENSLSITKISSTLSTQTGTGASGCVFDGNCTDSDSDGDQ